MLSYSFVIFLINQLDRLYNQKDKRLTNKLPIKDVFSTYLHTFLTSIYELGSYGVY